MTRFFSRDRLILICVCVSAALAGYGLRNDRPVRVASAVNDATQLARDAAQQHAWLQADHDAGKIEDAEWADRIEREILPLWRKAISLMDRARDDGASGTAFENMLAYQRVRLAASETLVAAIRDRNAAQLTEARMQWAAGDRLKRTFSSRPDGLAVLGR